MAWLTDKVINVHHLSNAWVGMVQLKSYLAVEPTLRVECRTKKAQQLLTECKKGVKSRQCNGATIGAF